MNRYTERALFWLLEKEYSRQHWETVAQECLLQTDGDKVQARPLLADSLAQFHQTFKNAVVKPDNVLHEFIEYGLGEVDWHSISHHFLP